MVEECLPQATGNRQFDTVAWFLLRKGRVRFLHLESLLRAHRQIPPVGRNKLSMNQMKVELKMSYFNGPVLDVLFIDDVQNVCFL